MRITCFRRLAIGMSLCMLRMRTLPVEGGQSELRSLSRPCSLAISTITPCACAPTDSRKKLGRKRRRAIPAIATTIARASSTVMRICCSTAVTASRRPCRLGVTGRKIPRSAWPVQAKRCRMVCRIPPEAAPSLPTSPAETRSSRSYSDTAACRTDERHENRASTITPPPLKRDPRAVPCAAAAHFQRHGGAIYPRDRRKRQLHRTNKTGLARMLPEPAWRSRVLCQTLMSGSRSRETFERLNLTSSATRHAEAHRSEHPFPRLHQIHGNQRLLRRAGAGTRNGSP